MIHPVLRESGITSFWHLTSDFEGDPIYWSYTRGDLSTPHSQYIGISLPDSSTFYLKISYPILSYPILYISYWWNKKQRACYRIKELDSGVVKKTSLLTAWLPLKSIQGDQLDHAKASPTIIPSPFDYRATTTGPRLELLCDTIHQNPQGKWIINASFFCNSCRDVIASAPWTYCCPVPKGCSASLQCNADTTNL